MITPTKIRKTDPKTLSITWSDGKVCEYKLSVLRKKCPCASCKAEQEAKGSSFIPLFAGDALELASVKPMGHYALQLNWKDGHTTGIYNYEYLRDLCPQEEGKGS